ncbi:hypothetical protein L1887_38106 [Cichorium endivia]|nr:hypothetical protein L1887_38106 [Cichorium endivia]
MESSSSNQYTGLTEYPYPSNLSAASFVSVKLSCKDNYHMWEAQMRCLLESHDMLGFITGQFLYLTAAREGGESFRLWRRSDAVVKGWILGSLSEEILRYVLYCLKKKKHQYVNEDFDAKSLWDEVGTIYNPPPREDFSPPPTQEIEEVHKNLHQATLEGDWDKVESILRTGEVTMLDKITNNGNTVLHVAASTTKKPKLLQKLLQMTKGDTQPLEMRNSSGGTMLHVAVIVGNTKTAAMLIALNPDFLLTKDNNNQMPLAIALSNMDTKMAEYLLIQIRILTWHDHTLFFERSGVELLAILISSKNFRLANEFVEHYRTFDDDTVLMAIAQNFPNELNIVEKYIGTSIMSKRVEEVLISVLDGMIKRCVTYCGSWAEILFRLFFFGFHLIVMFFPLMYQMLAWPFIKRVRIYGDAMELLPKVCKLIKDTQWDASHNYYKNSIFEATGQNAYEVVEAIVGFFPSAIWVTNQDGHNIIQYAVINRSEKVYNLLYQMSEHRNIYRTMKDDYLNNLLHLAGRLAPTNKLDLIPGAFLQIQRELQWFKEVQGFVSPLNAKQKNFFNETPQMVFTREHGDLVMEGEKWLKATAESYTITAALITTIVFAAAITVPGGNNQDTGIPMFTNNTAFTVFAISDAISLLTAVTSLLMFLSILTARYAEQDFLFKLPTKLIIGLVTLFISATAMLVASGATLYLVFGQSNSKILITIVVFTCLPIAAFVTLQSRLVIDLMSATYGRSIFGKKRDRYFY